MPHNKFKKDGTSSFGEEDFEDVFLFIYYNFSFFVCYTAGTMRVRPLGL